MDIRTTIIGMWEYEGGDFVYTFNADGTGSYRMGSFTADFTYKDNETSVEISYIGSTAPALVLDYSINDNVLNVIDSFGKDTLYIAKEYSGKDNKTAAVECSGKDRKRLAKKWAIAEFMTVDEDNNIIWQDAESILADPSVDPDDKTVYMSVYEFGEDGIVRGLAPIPDGCTEEEIEQAVESGEVELQGDRMVISKNEYREIDGELWLKSDTEVEFFGEEVLPWVILEFDGDRLCFMTFKLTALEEK